MQTHFYGQHQLFCRGRFSFCCLVTNIFLETHTFYFTHLELWVREGVALMGQPYKHTSANRAMHE